MVPRHTVPRGTSDKCTQRSHSRRLPLRLHKTFCFKLQANVQTSKTEINKQVCAGSAVARRAQGLRGPGRAPRIPSALPPAHVHRSSCIRQPHTRESLHTLEAPLHARCVPTCCTCKLRKGSR